MTYVDLLMRHHAWAVERLLDTAALVAPDQLASEELSHGSLLATLRHVADVDQSWGRAAQGTPIIEVEQLDAELADLQSLRTFWLAEVVDLVAFAASLTHDDLERDVQPPWKRRPYQLWQVLLHIGNHRAEHGNQIGWWLTSLGHSPGDMGFMAFVDRQRPAS